MDGVLIEGKGSARATRRFIASVPAKGDKGVGVGNAGDDGSQPAYF